MNPEIPSVTIPRLAAALKRTQPSRSSRLDRHPGRRRFLAQTVRVRRPRLSRRRRLHGPGQLGNRPRGRRAIRLHAPQRHHDLEPDGDPAAGACRRASASPADATSRRPAATATRGRSTIVLWLLCEIAIAACDLAEVIGAAIALNLLFGLPLIWGVCLTRARRADRAVPAAPRLPLRRSAGRRADRADRRLVRRRALARRGPTWPASRSGFVPQHRDPARSEHALHRDRHPRRDGDAAQPVPALVDRADAQVRRHRREQARRRSASRRSTRRSR